MTRACDDSWGKIHFEMEKFIGLCRAAICIQRFSRTAAEMPRETFCETPWMSQLASVNSAVIIRDSIVWDYLCDSNGLLRMCINLIWNQLLVASSHYLFRGNSIISAGAQCKSNQLKLFAAMITKLWFEARQKDGELIRRRRRINVCIRAS